MELIRSNRTENLADALASRIRDQALGPFDKEVIVVQSRGMERWLTLALADRLGIWGNPSFPFPRAVIEELLDSLSQGRSQEAKAYEPNRLKWTIAELLRETAPAELGAYLGEPPDADRTLRLATAVSVVFDGYVMYRPALLKRCANGAETGWQAELWRRVVERLGPHDLASRIDRALSALRAGEATERAPFKRLHLFSLETLPPMFLELFSVLSKTIPTAFYLLEPSCEYVSDVLSTPQLPADLDAPADGHQLLSTLGLLARDFQELLLTFDQAVHHEADLFEAPARNNLLGSLQADILEFRAPPEHGERETIDATDESISLHACSGPMREAQVVHDLIRAALEDDASLRPEDIVVMTPDLEAYAPAFRAVFGQED
ncbi:MAG: exodeoxyribonuclease V subunit gamma, partial [Polyangiales bacterium]